MFKTAIALTSAAAVAFVMSLSPVQAGEMKDGMKKDTMMKKDEMMKKTQ